MRIDIITVFPEMVTAALDHSIIKRAMTRGLVTIHVINLRDFTTDRHKTTDDVPYGGGGGMVMKVEPIARALQALLGAETLSEPADVEESDATAAHGVPSNGQDAANVSIAPQAAKKPRIALTDPRGRVFTQEIAREWAQEPHLILLCGHYEGVDERVRQRLVTDEISIGDYILTGGELPALVIVDALTRLQPGALGDAQATDKDTFTECLLEYPHYTRPAVYAGWAVPEILLSGHHAQIERWRRWHQLHTTQARRPDLLARMELSPQDHKLLASEEPQAPPDPKAARRAAQAAPGERAGETTHAFNTDYDTEEGMDGTRTTDNT